MINPGFEIDSSSINAVKAMVELYNGTTLVKTCTCSDILQVFTVDRDEENNKFFGFGVCQSVKTILIDLNRELEIEKSHIIKPAFSAGENTVSPYPTFYAEEVIRDEQTNSLTITAYDAIYGAAEYEIGEVELTAPYTVRDVAEACALFLGLNGIEIIGIGANETCFDTSYPEGANLSGKEKIRRVLNAIAEATQTIYYLNNEDKLIFKRLSLNSEPVVTITRDDYFSLKSGEYVSIDAICHTTELGDNVSTVVKGNENGVIQYIRDNPFWNMRDDIDTLLENAFAAVDGFGLYQFICDDWIGNYLLEIGDKIRLITEDGGSIESFVLNDSILFGGTLSEATQWTYEPNDNETAYNPTTLGETLYQTYAKVDKANKQINIVAGEAGANRDAIGALQINTTSISASVSSLEKSTKEAINGVNESYEELTKTVTTQITDAQASITVVEKKLENGVDKVTTTTGFVFDESGLNISQSGKEMTTQITADGMTVSNKGEETLVANNEGVSAVNLHATTYLIIGENSRFENYENGSRTACFWIGG